MDQLSTSWAMIWVPRLLCWCGTATAKVEDEAGTPMEEGATSSVASPDPEIDKPVFMKEGLRLGPFQTKLLLEENIHMIIVPLKVCKTQPDGAQPLPLGLHILHMYTWLKMSSSKVFVVVRNMSDSPIFLKKGVRVAHLVSALPVPAVELTPKMEAALGTEAAHEPMMVAVWQQKLLEKLNMDGLSNWTLRDVAAARELILAFHDIFALDGNKLGCTSAIEHEICLNNSEPFKEWFRHIPPPLLDEVHAGCGGDMPQPVPLVQCSGIGLEKGWNSAFLHGFLWAQCMY